MDIPVSRGRFLECDGQAQRFQEVSNTWLITHLFNYEPLNAKDKNADPSHSSSNTIHSLLNSMSFAFKTRSLVHPF